VVISILETTTFLTRRLKMSYCIYLRKSRADRDNPLWSDADVLARHEHTLTELAFNRGYEVKKIFREVVSGETLAARPQMQELLSEVEAGLWEGVLVMEVERLARGNSIDQGIVSQAFKYSNTLIITPNKIYNPANEFDEEYFEFGLFMSRREYKTINRRLNAGRVASCREGKYVGSVAPYGYKRVKIEGQKGYTLAPDENEAKVVQMIYKWYTADQDRIGTRLICQRLDDLGIIPRNGGKWSVPSVRDMLKNEVYIGKIVWNRSKEVKTTINGKIVTSRPRVNDYDVYDGLHPALIDEEMYLKAQEIMSKNPRNPSSKGKIKNPFAGLIVCGKCGKKMIRRPSNLYHDYLMCTNPYCDNKGAQMNVVEQKIYDGIKTWYKSNLVQISQNDTSSAVDKNKSEIVQIDKTLSKLNTQLTNTYNLLEQGLYNKETFVIRQKALTAEIKKMQAKRTILSNEDEAAADYENMQKSLIPKIETLIRLYNNIEDAEAKNKLLKEIFYKIIYIRDKAGRWCDEGADNFKLEFISKLK
jgi:DNA invertase Pin-like site-specific DNA recombinase